ncbi:AAA family ATPase, partial [Mycobacterium tuberculosis]|uniref:AAA family ATPase n=1 Tax=Mycobacterium tuberculosis TaxID=1773 RepID=UPI0015877DFE
GHTILSSDQLREEMFGDVNNQNNNGKVFEELHRRARELLEAGEKVIIDATNTNPMAVASLQNENRERKVPEFVIDRMYKNLHVPTFSEGWDDVVLVQNDKAKWMDSIRRRKYEHLLMQNPGLVLMDEIARFSP